MRKLITIFFLFTFYSCTNEKRVEIIIDEKTKKFDKIVQPTNIGSQYYKFSWSIVGYCDDTIEINTSRLSPGNINIQAGPSEFYGDPPIRVIYDPLNSKSVSLKIVYIFY